jgi:transcriptional regulator with XRE-family HTH domain
MRLKVPAAWMADRAKQKGFGPARLARYCGHSSHSYISRMMRGLPGTRTVTEHTARRIAEALDVPVDLLFDGVEVKSPDSTQSAA